MGVVEIWESDDDDIEESQDENVKHKLCKKIDANNFKVMVVCQNCHTTYEHTDIIGGGESSRCSFVHFP